MDDDFILDVSDSDNIVLEVGGHSGDSTTASSAPSVPMPVATTSMLAEMATNPPEYSFLQQSDLQPQAPLLSEVITQPQLSQAELIAMRRAQVDLDKMSLAQ